MLIKKIIIKNFRQYSDENEIEFSVDPEKNITFILGGTGFGKTTLCQAFRWCLYGKSDFKKPEDILSQRKIDALRDGNSCSAEVSLEMTHGGKNYIIKRSSCYLKKNDKLSLISSQSRVLYIENGFQKEVQRKDDFVKEIIPEELSEYFFLSGEKIEAMSDDIKKGKSKDFGDAVNTLLDLDYYKNAIKHLKSISRDYGVSGMTGGLFDYENKLNVLNSKLSANESNLKTFEVQLKEEEANRDYHIEKIAEYKAQLKNIESAKKLQQTREEKNAKFENLKKSIDREYKEGIQDFIRKSPYFFAKHNMKNMLMYLKDASNIESDDIPDKLHADLIDWIEKRGKCICGTCISKDEAEFNLIEKWRHVVPPESIGTLISSVKRSTFEKMRFAEDLWSNLRTRKERVMEYYEDIEMIEEEIKVLDERLAKAEDTSEIERNIRLSSSDLERSKNKITDYQKLIFNIKSEYAILTREREDLLATSEEGRKVLAWKNVTDRLVKDFETELSKDEHDKRQNLIAAVQTAFKKIYDADFTISIDDDYNITTTSKKELSTGQGLSVIFAFLSGLLDVIKVNKDDKSEMQLEAYPLVLDAPFSVLDKERIKSLCDVLPKVSEQIIVFIKDVDGEIAKERMQEKIGKSYKLVPADRSYQCTTVEED